MKFCGYGRVFSTVNDEQYITIGDFWDEMSQIYGLEAIRGLGLNWTGCSMEYIIGLKSGEVFDLPKHMEVEYREIELPYEGWETADGITDELPKIYGEIYKRGALRYEIETFFESGDCKIEYYR